MKKEFDENKRPLHEILGEQESALLRWRWFFFALIGLAGIIIGFLFFLGPKVREGRWESVQVAATIFPIYDIVRNVAGDAVTVGLVLPLNASPHTYEPTPSQVVGLSDVELFFAVGHGIDDWTDGLIGAGADKIVVDEGIAIISMGDRHRAGYDFGDVSEDEDEHGDTDPHYWLAVPNAKLIARNVRDTLIRKFPAKEATFEANFRRYLDALDGVEVEIRDMFSDVQNRNMITLHDSWYYFAVAYGFDIVGTFEPSAGREPTPRYLADLSATVAHIGAHVLYSEPQIATQGIVPFAEDYGLRIVELDPLGGVSGRDSYIKLMKYNAEIIQQNQN